MTLTYEEATDRLGKAKRSLRNLERKLGDAQSEANAAEANYRRELAQRYQHHRGQGKPVDESNTLARADVAHAAARDPVAREASGGWIRCKA